MPNHRKQEKSSPDSINHVMWYGCDKTNTTEFSNASCTTYYVTTWAYWHVHTILVILRCCDFTKHDAVIRWKHFPRCWPFVKGIHMWIPLTKASDAELWCFLWSAPEQKRLSKHSTCRWFEAPSRSLWRHCNDIHIQHVAGARSGSTYMHNHIYAYESTDSINPPLVFPHISSKIYIQIFTCTELIMVSELKLWYPRCKKK